VYILIAGGGKVGRNLTKDLLAMGHEVTVIEREFPMLSAKEVNAVIKKRLRRKLVVVGWVSYGLTVTLPILGVALQRLVD